MIAGAAVLAILLVFGIILLPPYSRYWRLQNYVTNLAENAGTAKQDDGAVRAQILTRAAALGLPVAPDNVHVAISQGAVKIDVLYKVQVNIAGYAVDLHFRPAAGT